MTGKKKKVKIPPQDRSTLAAFLMDPGEHLALSGPLVMMGEAGVAFLTVQPGVGTIFRINQEYRESLNWCHMVSSVKKTIKNMF